MPMAELGLETGGLGAWSVLFSFIDSDYIMEWGTGEPGEDTQQPSSFALFLMSCHLTHLPWNASTEVTYSPVEAALSFFLKGLEPKLRKSPWSPSSLLRWKFRSALHRTQGYELLEEDTEPSLVLQDKTTPCLVVVPTWNFKEVSWGQAENLQGLGGACDTQSPRCTALCFCVLSGHLLWDKQYPIFVKKGVVTETSRWL